jgi:hypothetical protein
MTVAKWLMYLSLTKEVYMKFYADPGHLVRISKPNLKVNGKNGFYFDENGEFETDNERLIALLKPIFKHDEAEELPFSEPVEEKKVAKAITKKPVRRRK